MELNQWIGCVRGRVRMDKHRAAEKEGIDGGHVPNDIGKPRSTEWKEGPKKEEEEEEEEE